MCQNKLVLSLILSFLAVQSAGDPMVESVRKELPAEAELLFEPGPENLTASGPQDALEQSRRGDETAPSRRLLQVKVKRKGVNQYEVQALSKPSLMPVRRGQAVLMALDIRCPQGGRESGEGAWYATIQRSVSPWDAIAFTDGPASRGWRRFYISGRADKDFDKGVLQVAIHLAHQPQTLEFGGFACFVLPDGADLSKLPFSKVTYPGMEPNAKWRAKAEQMIEKNRKAPLTIRVTRQGKPVSGAVVNVRQTNSSYPWGTFLDLDPTESTPQAAKYRELVPKLFNRVTVPIYWADWGWESESSRKGYFNRFEWAKSKGMPMKAHNLVWPSMAWSPSSLRPLLEKPDELRRRILTDAQGRLDMLKDQPFVNVDVLNELKTEQEFGKIAGFGFYADLFKMSRKAWPKADLVYNDYAIISGGGSNTSAHEEVKKWVRRLRADGAPLTMLGFQGHFGEGLTDPERVWQILDQFYSEFKLPIEVTEFDVDSRDTEAQAAYTRDLIMAWFAHPATAGFTMWGFWEGAHWKPNGAMYRRDWSPKPNLAVWKELTQKRFRSNLTKKTDSKGTAQSRVFHGDYTVTVTSAGRSGGANAVVTAKGSAVEIKLK